MQMIPVSYHATVSSVRCAGHPKAPDSAEYGCQIEGHLPVFWPLSLLLKGQGAASEQPQTPPQLLTRVQLDEKMKYSKHSRAFQLAAASRGQNTDSGATGVLPLFRPYLQGKTGFCSYWSDCQHVFYEHNYSSTAIFFYNNHSQALSSTAMGNCHQVAQQQGYCSGRQVGSFDGLRTSSESRLT